MKIYENTAGQNWQLLLPVAYKNKCGYIDEILFEYYIRENSHSRQEKTYVDLVQKMNNHEIILLETIKRLSIKKTEKNLYFNMVKKKYKNRRKNLYTKFNGN